MAGENKEILSQALDELVQSLGQLRDLGRRLDVREEKLVALARQATKPRPAAPPAAPARAAAPGVPAAGGDLAAIRADLGDCRRCRLAEGRTHLVFGEGNEHAELMFVGEGPGADEDRQGRPFVGRAGELLNKMIAAMGKAREEVFIANVVKCRPPNNREPEPDEAATCLPFLRRQIGAIRPKVIVTLGRVAVQALLETKTPISQMRGQWRIYDDIKVMPTFHPAYLLRNPDAKKPAWEDLQQVMKELGWSLPEKKK